ncbi:MAG: helix-turn-helix transcriptional regulator [Dehalococcoidia bacterium]
MARNELPELGTAIDAARRARGMTLEGLADRAGLAVNTIRNAIQGAPPNIVNLAAIATALDTTVGALLGETLTDDPRLAGIAALSDNLTDSDIETLTGLARQLASARTAALPARDDLPFWSELTPQEQAAYQRIEDLARRGSRLRQAPPSKPRAGRSDGTGAGRPGGGRRPGGAARA